MGLEVIRFSHGEPKWFCRVCQARGEPTVFYEDEFQSYVAHVTLCAERYDAELRATYSLKERLPAVYDPDWEGADAEWGRWIRKNADLILEGRKNMETNLDGL